MANNIIYLLDQMGNSVYQSSKQNNNESLNSFCLLNKTIASIFIEKRSNSQRIDLKQMKEYDKINNEKVKFNQSNELYPFYIEKNNFIEDSFYNDILTKKTYFENIHKDNIDFKMLKDIEKSNSSMYYHIQAINKLKESGELKKIEEKMRKTLEKLNKYERENYALISKEYECNGTNDFKYYKRVKANGNSFYISFIYQYIKNLVKNNDSILSEIFYVMEKELNILNKINNNNNKKDNEFCLLGEIYIDSKIKNSVTTDLIQGLSFLALLYNNINDNKLKEAEEILDYGFLYEESFANFFVLYMKFQIKRFIIINKDIFTYEKYCTKNKLIDMKYFEDEKFLYEKYINNNVITNQMEPSLFIISLVPYVFNVSMNLYINEKNHSFDKINFDLTEKYNIKASISILYSSFSYHIIDLSSNCTSSGYDNLDIANTLNIKNNNSQNFKTEDYISYNNEGIKCNICKNSNFIFLKNISKYSVCLNCFKNEIDEILIERYKTMKKEGFKYIEFYLRDIPVKKCDDNYNYIFLSPNEFYCLFENNMFNYFRNLIDNICDSCKKKKKNLIKKKCGCKICITCAEKEIKYIPITDFEKKYKYKDKQISCKCGNKNDFVEYSIKIYNKYNEEKKNQLQKNINSRIKELCGNHCMICGKFLNKDNIGRTKKTINKIHFEFHKELVEHYICQKCYDSFNNSSFFCIICNKKHSKDVSCNCIIY